MLVLYFAFSPQDLQDLLKMWSFQTRAVEGLVSSRTPKSDHVGRVEDGRGATPPCRPGNPCKS